MFQGGQGPAVFHRRNAIVAKYEVLEGVALQRGQPRQLVVLEIESRERSHPRKDPPGKALQATEPEGTVHERVPRCEQDRRANGDQIRCVVDVQVLEGNIAEYVILEYRHLIVTPHVQVPTGEKNSEERI